ncbi:hypothetical protein [Streptomyces sp. PSKA30]|uniref:hypothetical protein n=1 Tax=Streptomyces sp. PSKA30 TaxID=2874597 RepID=UPI001CD0C61D|nr:hypothetical protein [Streptomyces sp. PSKA30]MBZ9639546.1 hypothetical protein [Streptomyces sp. PSKA30]
MPPARTAEAATAAASPVPGPTDVPGTDPQRERSAPAAPTGSEPAGPGHPTDDSAAATGDDTVGTALSNDDRDGLLRFLADSNTVTGDNANTKNTNADSDTDGGEGSAWARLPEKDRSNLLLEVRSAGRRVQGFPDYPPEELAARVAQAYDHPQMGAMRSQPLRVRAERTINLILGGDAFPMRGGAHTAQPPSREESASAPPDQLPQNTAHDEAPLSPFITQYVSDHHVGLVYIEPFPSEVVDRLHQEILRVLGFGPQAGGRGKILTWLRSHLGGEVLARAMPYLHSAQGYRVSIDHADRQHIVDVQLVLSNPVRSQRHEIHGAIPDTRLERRAAGAQEFSGSQNQGTNRSVLLAGSPTFPIHQSGPVGRFNAAVSVAVTHNEFSGTTAVTTSTQTMTAQRSNELSWPVEFTTRWRVRPGTTPISSFGSGNADTSRGDAGFSGGDPQDSITIWFPNHLVTSQTGDLPEPAGLSEFPVWGVDSVRDPATLLTQVLQMPELAGLSSDSIAEVETFLSEANLRGNLPFQLDNEVIYSPLLLNSDGEVVGMIGLTAEVKLEPPMRRSEEGRINLEAHVSHSVKVESTARFTSGVTVEGSIGPNFTTDREAGHPHAADQVGWSLTGKVGLTWRSQTILGSGGSASVDHAIRSNRAHLLVPAAVAYTVTFVNARGEIRALDRPVDMRMRIRILPASDVRGERPSGAGIRRLPEDLENMRGLGLSATPLEVTAPTELFDRAEEWLRNNGFLPQPSAAVYDGPAARARLLNLLRFQQMRSRVGLRTAMDAALDGGSAVWFEVPTFPSRAPRRVQLRFTAERDQGRSAEHCRTLPGVQIMGVSSFNLPGTEGSVSSYGWTGGFGGGISIPVGLGQIPNPSLHGDWTYRSDTTRTTVLASGNNQDQFFIGTGQSTELFDVPMRYGLDLYEHSAGEPSRRFADGAEADPAVLPDEERGRPEAVVSVPGNLRLAVSHNRTVAPGALPPPVTPFSIRAATPRDDQLLQGGADHDGDSRAVRLPDDALMDALNGTGALLDAFQQIVTNTYPGREEASDEGALSTVASNVRSRAIAAGAVTGALPGSPTDPSTAFAEAVRAAFGPANLLARAHQIFQGGYVIEGLTLPGANADNEYSIELRGYLHNPEPLHSVKQYLETDVGATDAAALESVHGTGHRTSFALTTLQRNPAGDDTQPDSAVLLPSGRYTGSRRTDRGESHTTATGVIRTPTESGRQHRIRSWATILMTVRTGSRSILNTVAPESTSVTVAVDLPDRAQFLVSDLQLARYEAWFPRMGGLEVAPRPERTLRLPHHFSRTGDLGFASVLSVRQLAELPSTDGSAADSAQSSEVRDRLRTELMRLVEREAEGVTNPGSRTYLAGVRARIADLTSPIALRSLPGRGRGGIRRFRFLYTGAAGTRLVEVALGAEPSLSESAPDTVRGRLVSGYGGGQELVHLRAPDNTWSSTTVAGQHTFTVSPITRYLRPNDDDRSGRTGPSGKLSRDRTTTVRNAASAEGRFWLRTDSAADFDVPYEFTATVRSEAVSVPSSWGGMVGAVLTAWSDDDGRNLWQRISGMEPDTPATVTVPAMVALRFTGSEATDVSDSVAPLPPQLSWDNPLDRSGFAGAPRLVPSGPAPSLRFHALEQLSQAIYEVAPEFRTLLPQSAEAGAGWFGELVRSVGDVRAAIENVEPTGFLPGAYPPDSDQAPAFGVTLFNPRRMTHARDVASDRVRVSSRSGATTSTAGSGTEFSLLTAYQAPDQKRETVGAEIPILGQRPRIQGQGAASSATDRDWLKIGNTSEPADGGGPASYQVMVDTVISVHGPRGVRYILGSAEFRLLESDVLGHGVTAARPRPQVYDLPSLLAQRRDEDLRDWMTPPLGDLPRALAASLDANDTSAELWLALGADPDSTRLARALYTASRIAILARRPVELRLRTDEGGMHRWTFDETGELSVSSEEGRSVWRELSDRFSRHVAVLKAEKEALRRQSAGLAAASRLNIEYQEALSDYSRAQDALQAARTAVAEAKNAHGEGTVTGFEADGAPARARYDASQDSVRLGPPDTAGREARDAVVACAAAEEEAARLRERVEGLEQRARAIGQDLQQSGDVQRELRASEPRIVDEMAALAGRLLSHTAGRGAPDGPRPAYPASTSGDSSRQGDVTSPPAPSTLPAAGGSPVETVRDGECLLYAFLGGAPQTVRQQLAPADEADALGNDWLSDIRTIRRDLQQAARQYSRSRSPADNPPMRAAIRAIRDRVHDYLLRAESTGQLPEEVVRQLRLMSSSEEHERFWRADRPGLERLATLYGVLREGETAAGFTDGNLREAAWNAYVERPVDQAEYAELRDAVANWGERWSSPQGEAFPSLLAHAFGLRINVAHREAATGRYVVLATLGPVDATETVEVHYDPEAQHYSASDASPTGEPTPPGPDVHGESAGLESSTGGQASDALVVVPEPSGRLDGGPADPLDRDVLSAHGGADASRSGARSSSGATGVTELTEDMRTRLHGGDFANALVTKADLDRVGVRHGRVIAWEMEPGTPVPVGELGLSEADRLSLLLAQPHLAPDLARALQEETGLASFATEHAQDPLTDVSTPAPDAADAAPGGGTTPPNAERLVVEALLDQSYVMRDNGQAVAVWLPGNGPADGRAPEVVPRMAALAGTSSVLVFGDVRDGGVRAGDREVTPAALAGLLSVLAPQRVPVLTMPAGDTVAPGLAERLGSEVVASRYGAVFDFDRGTMAEASSPQGAASPGTGFLAFAPGRPEGRLAFHVLTSAPWAGVPEVGREPGTRETGADRRDAQGADDGAEHAPAGGPADPLPGLTAPVTVDPAVRSIGVPRAGLPYMADVIGALRTAARTARVTVEESYWDQLPQRLMSNYRYLLPSHDVNGVGGLIVPLGRAEALITLDPRHPREVREPEGAYDGAQPAEAAAARAVARRPRLETVPEEPDGDETDAPGSDHGGVLPGPATLVPKGDKPAKTFRANETVNAAYLTGAAVQKYTGPTGATRAGLGVNLAFGVPTSPLTDVVKAGVALSGTTNESRRWTTRVTDAEGGKVEDSRSDSRLLAYQADWSLRLRTDTAQRWQDIPAISPATRGDQPLLLWIPEHYLQQPPEQVTATGPEVRHDRLPGHYYASGLTNLPELFDVIVAELRGQQMDLPVGSTQRDELIQKVWNLEAHLDEAVNDEDGYSFALSRDGRPVATVTVRTIRTPQSSRVGETTDTAHLENVATAIDGTAGGQANNNSTTVKLTGGANTPSWIPVLKGGFSVSLGATWANSRSINTGRTGLWVVVPRYTGHTSAHYTEFTHQAFVAVRGRTPVMADGVRSRALVRIPEPEAFRYGFPVDRKALTEVPASDAADSATTVTYGPGRLRREEGRAGDPKHVNLPAHVKEGKGIGTGLVEIDEATVRTLRQSIAEKLVAEGFLPEDHQAPLAQARWWSHGNAVDSRQKNLDLLRKLVSLRGFTSHYDQLHQSGLQFILHRARGLAGVNTDVDAVRITIRAVPSEGKPPEFMGVTREWHTVALGMGGDSAAHSSSASTSLTLSFRFRLSAPQLLRGSEHGVDVFRQVAGSEATSYFSNRPELLEYPGAVNKHKLYSDYKVTMEFQHSGVRGAVRPGRRDPEPITLPAQPAVVYLPPLGDPDHPGTSMRDTPDSVLDHAVVYYLDATGLHAAATAVLGELTGPQGAADAPLSTFTSTISVRAHLKEVMHGRYTSDQFFESGFLTDTFAGVDISGRMTTTRFAGATPDSFVIGNIKLFLAEARTGRARTDWGVSAVQADVTVGHGAGHADVNGGVGAVRRWQRDTSAGEGRTGGKELIQLDFNRAYAFRTAVDFTVRSRREEHGKLKVGALSSKPRAETRQVEQRTMIFLLPEPTALEEYARNALPVSDEQLVDVMNRWLAGELRLSGNTVAGVLLRWQADTPDLGGLAASLQEDRGTLAARLGGLHENGSLPVQDEQVRLEFNRRFGLSLRDPEDPYSRITLPEYLTRTQPRDRILGHSGIQSVSFDDHSSTYEIARTLVDEAAPGLLTADAELWSQQGRKIGRLQGGVNWLQALLAEGRDSAMWEEFLGAGGQTFYLVNPVGWLLSDIVEITISDVLTSAPRVHDFRPGTGLENYGHGHVSTSSTRARGGGQSITGRLSGSGASSAGTSSGSSTVNATAGESHHRNVTRAEVAVTEQTVYDWGGHYRVTVNHTMTVSVRRINMAGRPLNAILTGWYRSMDRARSAVHTISAPGTLELQIPRGLAESPPPAPGASPPRDLRPLPALPGDAYVTGVVFEDARPAGEKLLRQLFGKKAADPGTETSQVLRQMLGRTHLTNHLHEASAGRRYLLADHVFLPGDSRTSASLWLTGDLVDLQVLGPVQGTGTGRYAKHQSGTTHTAGTEFSSSAAASVSATDPAPEDRPATSTGDTSQTRRTAAGPEDATTENYRREQHVKQQGPVYLVRLRGRYRLEAQMHEQNPLWRRDLPGLYRSDTFTGDVYAEIFQAEVESLLARIDATSDSAAHGDTGWAQLERAPRLDLGHLLGDAAQTPDGSVPRLYQSIASAVRRQATEHVGAVVFDLDTRAVERAAERTAVHWALETIERDVAAAQVVVPERVQQIVDGLRLRQNALDPMVHRPGSAQDRINEVIQSVNDARTLLRVTEQGSPATLPPMLAIPSMSYEYLVRDLAHELGAHLRVDFTLPDGRRYSRWAQPSGHVYAFDPLKPDAPGHGSLTLEAAEKAGLLTPGLRSAVEDLGIGDDELGTVYRTSWQNWQRSFSDALSVEVERRRTRLAFLSPPQAGGGEPLLVDLFHRALSLSQEQSDDSGARSALDRLRELARGTESADPEQISMLAEDLRRLLSPSPGRPETAAESAGAHSRPAEPAHPPGPPAPDGDQAAGTGVGEPPPGTAGTTDTWLTELERDAGGFKPDTGKLDDGFPTSRLVAFERYRASYDRMAALVAASPGRTGHDDAAVDTDAAGRHAIEEAAARVRLGRDERALRAWGHADPEGLVRRYREHIAGQASRGGDATAPQEPVTSPGTTAAGSLSGSTSAEATSADGTPLGDVPADRTRAQQRPGADGPRPGVRDSDRPAGIPDSGSVRTAEFTFLEGEHELTGRERIRLNDLAREVVRAGRQNTAKGLPLPTVRISAGGNGSMGDQRRGARETAEKRLQHLTEAFRRALNDERFVIDPKNRGRDLPAGTVAGRNHRDLRRRAVVTVEIPSAPSGPPTPAERGLTAELREVLTSPEVLAVLVTSQDVAGLALDPRGGSLVQMAGTATVGDLRLSPEDILQLARRRPLLFPGVTAALNGPVAGGAIPETGPAVAPTADAPQEPAFPVIDVPSRTRGKLMPIQEEPEPEP